MNMDIEFPSWEQTNDAPTVTWTEPYPLPPPSGLCAVVMDRAHIKLAWAAQPGAEGYYVYRGSGAGSPFEPVGMTDETAYVDGGLRPGTTYYYKVAAFACDTESEAAGPVQAVTTAERIRGR